jgi:hypothetical protein
VKVVAALTLWSLFSAWLLFPRVGAPRMLRTAAGMLMWLQFVSLLTWGYAEGECSQRFCAALADAAENAATVDVPGLTVAMLAVSTAYAARRVRAARRHGGLRRA